MPRLGVVFALLPLLCGCSRELPDLKPYTRPAVKEGAAKVTCESLSREEGARWSPDVLRVHVDQGSKLALSDASVLGGPFELPLTLEVPVGDVAVRVLLGTTLGGEGHPLCVEMRWKEGRAATWKPLGDIALDSDMLAIVDDHRYLAASKHLAGQVFAGIEGDAIALPPLLPKLAAHDLPMDLLLPTFARATRPLQQGDRAIIEETLRETNSPGRYLADPGMPAYAFLRALHEKPAAHVETPSAPDSAIAIESSNGDGAYPAAIALDDSGNSIFAEVRLSP